MPKNADIKKVLVIGSGPIIIGQAAEFDYAGTQACLSLKEEGISVVLVNSNPATIMTDTNIADAVYIEPLTPEMIKKIVEKEKPDSVLPTLGGQTGLNLAMELSEEGFWEKAGVRLLGTNVDAIKMAEDRQSFKDAMASIGEPCIVSRVVTSVEDALSFSEEIGYPVIVRPGYTLGGTGGGIADNPDELKNIASGGLRASRVHQILIEKCVSGYKEIEYEVIRDAKGNRVTICNMENIDPVGVHTGDSIVVAPCQTLTDRECAMLRTSAFNIIEALGIEGGCNVQYALDPNSYQYYVIEVNPRVSRSSALASKATGYPIAKVASKIAIGYTLDEIQNAVTKKTSACFEPTIDYVVIKVPKWPFDKFLSASRTLGTQMKATGEVMAIGVSVEDALMKAVRGTEMGWDELSLPSLKQLDYPQLEKKLYDIDDARLFAVAEALRRGMPVTRIAEITKIDPFFIEKIYNIVKMEDELEVLRMNSQAAHSAAFTGSAAISKQLLLRAKKLGFTDAAIARRLFCKPEDIRERRETLGLIPVYKRVDTCAAEFEAATPYYYKTYDEENESLRTDKPKVLVIGSGPIRIGQGIEFDYCSVHCIWAFRAAGYETIIINNNPETVSTDFDTADKLYFEPLTPEDIEDIVRMEKPDGACVQFGGQTAIKLAAKLTELGVPIFGTSTENIDAAEDREKFDAILEDCGISRPDGTTVFTAAEAVCAAQSLGYPVLIRPSYVLGGLGMRIAYNDKDISDFMTMITSQRQEHPILVDKYMMGTEIEVDAICDGTNVLIPGIMEHLERAGVHSGDSISVYPALTVSDKIKARIVEYTQKLAARMAVKGLMNIQFVLYSDELYVIEVNPRSSRTVPYISKVTGIPMVDIAVRCMTGEKLADLPFGVDLYKESGYYCVKVPVFSFEKLHGAEISLGPEMKSTGEVLGIDRDFNTALFKGLVASGFKMPTPGGGVLITVADQDKDEIVELADKFNRLGYKLYATFGTAQKLEAQYIPVTAVHKIGADSPDILDHIVSGGIHLVVNTPGRNRKTETDGLIIRRKSVEHAIPCMTSPDTARALLWTLEQGIKESDADIYNVAEIT